MTRTAGPSSVRVVTDDGLEAWQTSARGPFVTIRAGGPLDGVVTITAISKGHGHTLVEAQWTEHGTTHSESVEVDAYEQARTVAHAAAAELAVGNAPSLVTPLPDH